MRRTVIDAGHATFRSAIHVDREIVRLHGEGQQAKPAPRGPGKQVEIIAPPLTA